MSAQPVVMVIPPRAVSRLFGACANAPEGAAPPSQFDFGACFKIGMGNKSLNQITRAQNNGILSDYPGGPNADEKKRQEQFEDYLRQLWLSRMSEEYQRAYKELMRTIEEAEKFCDNMERELAEKREIVDREMERVLKNAVEIDGQEFIPDGRGGYTDRHGRPRNSSNTRPEVLAEVDRRYKQEPWRMDALSDAQDWIKAKENLERIQRENYQFKQDLRVTKDSRPESPEDAQKTAEDFKNRQKYLKGNVSAVRAGIDALVGKAQATESIREDVAGIKAAPNQQVQPTKSNQGDYKQNLSTSYGEEDAFGVEATAPFNQATIGNVSKPELLTEPLYPAKADTPRIMKLSGISNSLNN